MLRFLRRGAVLLGVIPLLLGVVLTESASAERLDARHLPAGLTSAVSKATGTPARSVRRSLLAGTQQRLRVPNTDLFGFSVALSANGSTALIGAPNTDSVQGAAFVFNRTGTVCLLQQKLRVPPPPQLGALRFGTSVSLSSD